jgi:exonuclease III
MDSQATVEEEDWQRAACETREDSQRTVLETEEGEAACGGGGVGGVGGVGGGGGGGVGGGGASSSSSSSSAPASGAAAAAASAHLDALARAALAVAAIQNASLFRGRPHQQRSLDWQVGGRFTGTQLTPHDPSDDPNPRAWRQLIIPDPIAKGLLCRGSVRFLTHNVNGIGRRSQDGPGLKHLLRPFQVIALQELKADEATARRALATACPPLIPFLHTCGGSNGVAVLLHRVLAQGARTTHKDFVSVPGPGDPPAPPSSLPATQRCRAITVEAPALGLTIVCVHRYYEGADCTPILCAHVQALQAAGSTVVVMGDLNAWPDEARKDGQPTVLARLGGREAVGGGLSAAGPGHLGLLDCTHGTSEYRQPSHFPAVSKYDFQRLDYILLPQRLRQLCLVPGSGRVLSNRCPDGDHAPVECTLQRCHVLW